MSTDITATWKGRTSVKKGKKNALKSAREGISKLPKLSGDFGSVQSDTNSLTVNLETTTNGFYWATVHISGIHVTSYESCGCVQRNQSCNLPNNCMVEKLDYLTARLTLRVLALCGSTLLGVERLSSLRLLLSNQLQLFDNPRYANVAFVFERDGKTLKIYASTQQLQTASEYFSDMFASGGFEAGSEGLDEEDSDIEVDCHLFEAVQVDESETPTESHPVTEIKITRTCYSTFRALLYYLLSREISFKQLRSSKDHLATAFDDSLNIESASWPKAPVPVSPKSMYRLADEHSIMELRKLAGEHICDSLTENSDRLLGATLG
ncbi:hypothetical protein BT69DRAFT_833411 [Atractiella rhizophila]|nr:hypothetical protein BT69DRAFT_833411 [Atractiella rhizophila]